MKFLIFLLSLSFVATDDQVAPFLSLTQLDGSVSTLQNYKGQVVYLSFWASWCGPCKQNFQRYEETRKELADQGVILLNVSVDKDIDKWKQALQKFDYINGINVRATDIPQVMKDYQLTKVPDYHIINKAGHFVYLSDKPGRNIVDEFKVWVKE